LFAGTLFVRVKLLRIQIDPDPARRAHDALAVVIGFAGLILAFSLVQEQLDPEPGRQSLIYPEMLKKIDELTLARETRLVAAINIRLAPIFWESIVFLLLILLILAALSESTFSLSAALALGCQGFAVTLLVALVFAFDRPFTGRTSVSPQPITKVIAEMQNR
jgi:hypothetical protein